MKRQRRFEVVPIAEVLPKLSEFPGHGAGQKTPMKDELYATPLGIGRGHEFVRGFSRANAHHGSTEANTMKKRVLVVDDESLIADTLAAIFRKAGYDAEVAYDGLSALSRCDSFLPDLVITDVVMPAMNGIAMAVKIQQRYPACKILLFSGQAATADLLEEARQGGHDFEFLSKPIHPSELLAKIA